MRAISKVIIHCADTPNRKYFDVKDIDSWHKERGFNKTGKFSMYCGYHYVIRVDGIVEKGRKLNETGAHCKGQNSKSIGVCLIGKNEFTDNQWQSLKELLIELKEVFGKNITIHGHSEFATHKTCPNFDVQKELEKGRLKG